MLKIAVLVSGGGTNLQAIMDAHRRSDDHKYEDRSCDQQQ